MNQMDEENYRTPNLNAIGAILSLDEHAGFKGEVVAK